MTLHQRIHTWIAKVDEDHIEWLAAYTYQHYQIKLDPAPTARKFIHDTYDHILSDTPQLNSHETIEKFFLKSRNAYYSRRYRSQKGHLKTRTFRLPKTTLGQLKKLANDLDRSEADTITELIKSGSNIREELRRELQLNSWQQTKYDASAPFLNIPSTDLADGFIGLEKIAIQIIWEQSYDLIKLQHFSNGPTPLSATQQVELDKKAKELSIANSKKLLTNRSYAKALKQNEKMQKRSQPILPPHYQPTHG